MYFLPGFPNTVYGTIYFEMSADKGRGETIDKLTTSTGSLKAREVPEHLLACLDHAVDCADHNELWKILSGGNMKPALRESACKSRGNN